MPVVGFTGTGGAGKSSVVDELVRRFRARFRRASSIASAARSIPTRRRTGGALLGDRIRMNAIHGPARLHALARHAPGHLALSRRTCARRDRVSARRRLRSRHSSRPAGIGQSDTEIVDTGRPLALRDDPRVRRGHAAREDRHARLRRPDRHQQVRQARRRGRAARRAQAVASATRAVRRARRGAARVRHDRVAVQRPRHQPLYAALRELIDDSGSAGRRASPASRARRSERSHRRDRSRRERVRYLAEIAETCAAGTPRRREQRRSGPRCTAASASSTQLRARRAARHRSRARSPPAAACAAGSERASRPSASRL